MLSGLKFIPRDQIDAEKNEEKGSVKERRKSKHRKERDGKRGKSSQYHSSDDELDKIKSGSRKKKKWYASDEDSVSETSSSSSESGRDRKKRKRLEKSKRTHDDSSEGRHRNHSVKKTRQRTEYSSEDTDKDVGKGSQSQDHVDIVRKEMGLEWMLLPRDNADKTPGRQSSDMKPEVVPAEEVKKDNPRELNPYLKNDGSGYLEESNRTKAGDAQLLSAAVVGDGGASWRLKAMKRAKEQAAREGRTLKEVVGERWSSMGHLAASVASSDVAPARAHLQAINNRRKGIIKDLDDKNDSSEKSFGPKGRTDDLRRHPKMRVPKVDNSLSWGKQRGKNLPTEDAALVSDALSDLNKFSNDGSFMDQFKDQNKDNSTSPSNVSPKKTELRAQDRKMKDDDGMVNPSMSANQLAAKALQLKMKGKHEEAEKLMKEAEKIRARQDIRNEGSKGHPDGSTSRYIIHDHSERLKKKEEDSDHQLAKRIMHNHQYSTSNQADEEYDYDEGPRKKNRKKGGNTNNKSTGGLTNTANRFLTQQERCHFCFESSTRPKHLVIAIANFTYLALPHQQPLVPGHCGILTLQHEPSTRMVDDNVWDEIRNFKKCLIMMFAKQEKDVVFFETVMDLARQRRHCMVECVPLPRDVAKQAPVYFKKAIDEAEDEWSQHNAKKLIDTSEKGLRGSIPKNFPYFHVEFGLNKGFVHVIDDEKEFKSSFGLNVIRGILQMPAEDMHRRRRNESVEAQKKAVADFARDWKPFDWTKQLD